MKNTTAQLKNQKGFTLIELLVVILIIGVLAAGLLALIDPIGKVKQAQDAGLKDYISQVATAEESYYSASQTTATPGYYYNTSFNATRNNLVTYGELRNATPPPGTYTFSMGCTGKGSGCSGAGVDGFYMCSTLQHPSIKNGLAGATADGVYCFRSKTYGGAKEIPGPCSTACIAP